MPVLAGCTTAGPRSATRLPSTDALPVPFIAQQPNYCGPAALAMLAGYYGHSVSQEDIATDIYLPEIQGTLTTELADYGRRFGLWTRPYRGSMADLRQKLAARIPLIVLGRIGASYHYFVVLGMDDDRHTLVVHSDTRAGLTLREDDFRRWWDRTDRWTLLVCPPVGTRWGLSAEEHNDRALFHERNGDLRAAAADYRAAVDARPDHSWFWMNLGNVLLKQRLLREAAEACLRAVQLEPENADALNNLAWVYHELGANLEEAEALSRRAVALRPSHSAYYLDTLGCVLLKQGKRDEAVAAFEQALAATSDRQSSLRAAIQQRLDSARTAP